MKIHAITVSVNYADILEQCLPTWFPGLTSLVVVTSHADGKTKALCHAKKIPTHRTDIFWRNGAAFNKWAAVQQAIDVHGFGSDWFALIDADIKLPAGWEKELEITPGHVYGCKRRQVGVGPINDMEIAGFFMLMHRSDPVLMSNRLFELDWNHAGNGDTVLLQRWPMGLRRWLPFTAGHVGTPGQNWFGRGNLDAMEKMREDRRAGKHWITERTP